MKINRLYDCASFDRFRGLKLAAQFKDAAAGVVLERNLTHIDPRIITKKYPGLTFLNSGIVISNEGGYAQRITSKRRIHQGNFTEAGDRDDNKGKISLSAEDSTIKVIEKTGFSEWTDTEVEQASIENRNLPQEFLETHMELYQRDIDSIGFLGNGSNLGLLNNTSFVSAGAAGAIAGLTAQEMYDEIRSLITDQWDAVSNTEEYKANRVVMPVNVYNTLKKTILNSAGDSSSVMTALRANFPEVTFEETFRAGSVAGTSRTVAYNNSADGLIMRVPEPLNVGEIIRFNSFRSRVDSKYRVAGLDILVPVSGRILTGL